MKKINPFLIKGYKGPEYFCDRVLETQKLISAIENGRDVTLMAPRRYGKTGLIQHVFHGLDASYAVLYLDIFNIKNLTQFVKVFASRVVEEFSTPLEKTGKGLLDFFRGFRPTMIPQEDGLPKFSFDIAPSQAEMTLKETFEFLKSRKIETVIAIDEFQQIREFPEKGVEALLRSYIQFCHTTHFIFAGSKQHLMQEMFATPQGPFYQSTQLMTLDVIGLDNYRAYAKKFFESEKKLFDDAVFDRLYQRFNGITWYLQAILNRVWSDPLGLSSDEVVESAVGELIAEGSLSFHDLLNSQTSAAQSVLMAIANEGIMSEPSSKAMIDKYGLPSGSTVRSVITDLLTRDLICKSEKGCSVYDKLFAQWLREQVG